MREVLVPLGLSFAAGISTVLGGLILYSVKDFKKSYLSFFLGISAGSMIYLSFIELMPQAVKTVGFLPSNLAFFLGILLVGIFDAIVPRHFLNYCSKNDIKYDKLMVTGVMVAVGIALHNFPEGIAVFMSSISNIRLGILIAFATAIHNIPEGIAVATPIYYATKNKALAFGYTLLAGIAEPVGAILTYLILRPYISDTFLAYTFAFVAGIMIYISLDELLPSCFENGKGHTAMAGIVTGMIVMALSLSLV